MKKPMLFVFFSITAPFLSVLRVVQEIFLVDQTTGFLKEQYQNVGNVIIYACYIFMAIVIAAVLLIKKEALRMPYKSMGLCAVGVIASILLLISGFLEAFNSNTTVGFLGICSATVVAWYSFSVGVGAHFPKGSMIVLPIYTLLKLILDFMGYRGEAKHSYAVFNVLAMVSMVLFSLFFAKIVNRLGTKKSGNVFYISALLCSFLCLSQGLIPIIGNLVGASLHSDISVDLGYVAFGMLAFTAAGTAKHEIE